MPPKKNYSSSCFFCGSRPLKKRISVHKLQSKVTEEIKQKWLEIVPELSKDPGLRICSEHFLPSDFERDLRNEMLGLPPRRILKSSAVPRCRNPEEMASLLKTSDEEPKKDVKPEVGLPVKHMTKQSKEVAEKLTKEVDLVTEIAELQRILLEKVGKNLDMSKYQQVLSDPCDSNRRQMSKESIIFSLKNQIYRKKPTTNQKIMPDDPQKDDLHLVASFDGGNEILSTKVAVKRVDLVELCNLDPEEIGNGPFAILDRKGHTELKNYMNSARKEKDDYIKLEPSMKEISKSKVESVRKRMIIEGEKSVDKLQADIEMYKLKVIELRLWKRKWRSQQRSIESKKRNLREKLDKRRAFIKDQISKGYMHKSCKVLVHSRSKFPYEPGFDATCNLKKLKRNFPNGNLSQLIKGTFLAEDGLVYPCKKKVSDIEKPQNDKHNSVTEDGSEDDQITAGIAGMQDNEIVEPIFTIDNEHHYIITQPEEQQEVNLADPYANGVSAVIQFIQIDQSGGQVFQRL